MNVDLSITPALDGRIHRARLELREAEMAIEEHILQKISMKKYDVVRHKETGFLYRVDCIKAVANRITMAYVVAYRVYTTGRREARSSTCLYFQDFERMEPKKE